MSEPTKTRFFWGGFVIVTVFVFSPFFASAQTFTFSDVSITNYQERVYWNVYESLPANSAIVQGKLSMNVSGISDSNGSSEYGKLNLFGMIDAGQGADMNDRSYWLQVRRNTSEYAGILPQISVKGRIDCVWFDGDSSNAFDHPWDPEQTYRMELSWDKNEATLHITGEDGLDITAPAVFPKPFAPRQQAVYFGSSPASIAYEALPAFYSDISLEAEVIESGVSLPGERCPIEEEDEDLNDPDNPYDTCSCHAIPDLNAKPPCEDPLDTSDPWEMKVLKSDFPFGWSFVQAQIVWLWTIPDAIAEIAVKQEQFSKREGSLPDIGLEFAPLSLVTGEKNSAIAVPANFRSRMQNMYFSWCAVSDGRVYPMNGVAAGGQLLPELTNPNKSWSEGACCDPITRIPPPEYDLDNDGMDDRWEEKNFLGRTVNGITYTDINQVLPDDDPDGDGYLAHTFRNEKGEYITATPYLIDKFGNAHSPGAEGRLTNIMEYILDTDPLNGDTDGDGYSDGMDFIGVGQMQLDFMVDKNAGPEGFYDISVAAVGTNDAKKVSLVSTKQRAFIGGEGLLKINLQSDKEVMTFDDSQPLNVSVQIVSGEGSLEDFTYEWFFNTESVCDGVDPDFIELCDVGQVKVTFGNDGISFFDLPEPTGEIYPIAVKVVSPANGAVATATINLPVATPTNLVTVDCAGQTEEIESLVAGSNIPVFVCISEIDQLAATANLSDYNFIWKLDGFQDSKQSGSGRSQFALVPTKPAGSSQILTVSVKEVATGKIVVNAARSFTVAGPDIKIVSPETKSNDDASENSYRFATFPPGHVINFRAELKNLVGVNGYEVDWLVNGKIIETEIVEGDESFFSYALPVDAVAGAIYDISLTVKSLDLETNEQGSDRIKILVGEPDAATGSITSLAGNLAAVFTKIPDFFKEIIKYAAILAVVFFGLVYLYPKASRFLQK